MSNPAEREIADAVTRVARLAGRSLAALTGEQLTTLAAAGVDITLSVFEEQARRKTAATTRGHLRLAAQDGELTAFGRAAVQVHAHNAAKARRRRSA